jgi:cytochrome c553
VAKRAGGGPKNLVTTGKAIYEEGVPEADIPACAACHGPEAKGQEAIPRLAGQFYPYVVKELTNWSKERGKGPAKDDRTATMASIAQSLTQAQIAALAAYINHLK